MSEKFHYFNTKHMSLPKKRGWYGTKRHEKYTETSEIPPEVFIGGLYKTHSVMCSKLVEVHAINVD